MGRFAAGLVPICLLLLLPGSPSVAARADVGRMRRTFSVTMTPEDTVQATAHAGRFVASYTVKNTGTNSDTYTLTCGVTGLASCDSIWPASVTLSGGAQHEVEAFFTTGDSTGIHHSVTATATGGATASAQVIVLVAGSLVKVVSPSPGGPTLRLPVHTRQPILRALFPGNIDTTKTVVTWRGTDVTASVRQNVGLTEWEVDSAHRLGVGDSAQWSVKACVSTICTTEARWIVLANDSTPVVDFTGGPLETLGAGFSSGFGPGLGVSSAELETGLGTVPYVSMGAARSTGLVYSTRTSYPRALVPVNVELPWPAGTADQLKLVLFDGATRLDSLTVASPACATGRVHRCRVVLQGDFSGSSISTPVKKWLTVQTAVTVSGTTKTSTDSTEVVLVDRRTTRYGSGWWPSVATEMFGAGNDRVLVAPNGAATIYRGTGDSVYLPPPGGSTVLLKVATGWELHPRGTNAKVAFDSLGRLQKAVDQNGNRDSVAYGGTTDQVDSIIDPLGKVISFSYSGGKLTTITSLAGLSGARQTAIRIDTATNKLTYDSLSTPSTRPATTTYLYQTYGGTGTMVLTKRIGVLADTTETIFDSTFKRRPVQVKLPAVPDTNGTTVKPTISYTPYEQQGFGALRSLDSVYVEMKDPRSNWTRSLLNRWGEALLNWDALGTTGQSTYTPEGLPLWSQGKNGDSSRVFTAYDSRHRVSKTYITRSTTDTLRLDSLVYDATDRVRKEINSLGQVDSVAYDANGNPNYTRDPQGNITQRWFHSDGVLDSVRAPGDARSTFFRYDATWRNQMAVVGPDSLTVDSVLYDKYGRDTTHLSKLRVQTTQTATSWQWRKTITSLNVAGQTDSAVTFRTDNCADPCASPPTWPARSDTVRTQRVSFRYDRAGRDSLRLNDRGTATLYTYDRLGRLIRRRPWTDSTTVRDSMVYDVAGNLVKTSTAGGSSSPISSIRETGIP